MLLEMYVMLSHYQWGRVSGRRAPIPQLNLMYLSTRGPRPNNFPEIYPIVVPQARM